MRHYRTAATATVSVGAINTGGVIPDVQFQHTVFANIYLYWVLTKYVAKLGYERLYKHSILLTLFVV